MNLENSPYKIEASRFHKTLEVPSSKSHSNRALILGAIKGNGFTVENISLSTDVLKMLDCLKAIGLKIKQIEKTIIFLNSFPNCENETKENIIDLKTGDGGTTNRFLLALLSRGIKTYRLIPSERLSERPINDLIKPLELLDVKIDTKDPAAWLSVKGPAHFNKMTSLNVNCEHSTQFASALMLAFSDSHLIFKLENLKASEAYVEMTKHLLQITSKENRYTVPVDFSSLSYPLALALIAGEVHIPNCIDIDELQADSFFIELMRQSGADIHVDRTGLYASSKNSLKPFAVNGAQCPDLIPTLAFMASHIEGESVLTNLSILRHKESDRIEQTLYLLKIFSINFQFISERDEIRIIGTKKKYPKVDIRPERDHRIVMAAYLFLRANQGGTLAESDCVEKSFPHFFELMN